MCAEGCGGWLVPMGGWVLLGLRGRKGGVERCLDDAEWLVTVYGRGFGVEIVVVGCMLAVRGRR